MVERADRARSSASSNPVRVRFGRFELDEANARLLRDGKAVALAPTPFAVLCALVRQSASLITKNALLDEVWGHQFVSESVLKTASAICGPRWTTTPGNRASSKLCRGAAIGSWPPRPRYPAPPGAPRSGFAARRTRRTFIGRAEALSRLRRAWDIACGGKRAVVWVAGEPGIGKTTLIERFVAGSAKSLCARAVRGAIRCRRAVSSRPRSARRAVPQRQRRSDLAARGRADLAAAATVAQHRRGARRVATRARGRRPDRMLREMGELLDRYTASAGRCCSSPRTCTGATRRPCSSSTTSRGAVARRAAVARQLPPRRRYRARPSAHAVRHELRLHGLCEEIVLDAFSETEVAEYVAARVRRSPPRRRSCVRCTTAPTACRCSWRTW